MKNPSPWVNQWAGLWLQQMPSIRAEVEAGLQTKDRKTRRPVEVH
jgi:hypothetical protein